MERIYEMTIKHMRTWYKRLNDSNILKCIRNGLVMMIPILLIGSFCVVFRSIPIPFYQNFLQTDMGSILDSILLHIYYATFGILGIHLTICISLCYVRQKESTQSNSYGAVIASLIAFCIFSGFVTSDTFDFNVLGAKALFTGVVCALSASALYDWISSRISRKIHFYSDWNFYTMLTSILPILAVSCVFALINLVLVKIFHVSGFLMLFSNILNGIFESLGRTYLTTVLFLLISNVLWFFGVHGTDALETVNQELYVQGLELNQSLIAQGLEPTEIYSKTFMDVFVNMGGCGTAWCLILAILLFSKRKSNRGISELAVVPGILNVSEIVVFGLPVVYNPIFLVPFILTPLAMLTTSTLAVQLGLVPITVYEVEWTTPIILGGYVATGSVAGSLLQIVNLLIGIFIYRPFVKIFDRETDYNAIAKMKTLVGIVQKSEYTQRPVELISLNNDSGNVARMLAAELREQMRGQELQVYYQPQFNNRGECIGAEALLRWKHPTYGMVYPPLIVELADESNKLLELEETIFKIVVSDLQRLIAAMGENAKISVNITGYTIQSDEFERFLSKIKDKHPEACSHIVIEITEQAALLIDDELIERFNRIRKIGFSLAIDDFSMGSTSIKYLQTNIFELIKLDGSLCRDITDNERSRNIIASIAKLSNDFGIDVLAECVETEKQRGMLEKANCYLYQGYLYSPAITLEELEQKKYAKI